MGFPPTSWWSGDYIAFIAASRLASVGPGVGLGGGSLVVYALGYGAGPGEHGFAVSSVPQPASASPICLTRTPILHERRSEVIEYVTERLGADKSGPDHHLQTA